MTYRGTIKNGVVVLEPGAALPEGRQVEVTPVDQAQSLHDSLEDLVGVIDDLPDDAARNKRHYLYGHEKK